MRYLAKFLQALGSLFSMPPLPVTTDDEGLPPEAYLQNHSGFWT